MKNIFKSILILLLVQLTFNLICFSLGYSHPYNIFLFEPKDRFADILKTSDSFGVADTWVGNNSGYRPLLNALPPLTLFIEISFGYLVKFFNSFQINKTLLLFCIYLIFIFTLYKSIISKVKIPDNKFFFLICILNYGFIFFFR